MTPLMMNRYGNTSTSRKVLMGVLHQCNLYPPLVSLVVVELRRKGPYLLVQHGIFLGDSSTSTSTSSSTSSSTSTTTSSRCCSLHTNFWKSMSTTRGIVVRNFSTSSSSVRVLTKENMELQSEEGTHSNNNNKTNFVWNPKQMLQDLSEAAPMVQRNRWTPERCLAAVESYQNHLSHYNIRSSTSSTNREEHNDNNSSIVRSSTTAVLAVRCLLKSQLPTVQLRRRIRELERCMGSLVGSTIPMTDDLSFVLLEANGKAGNVGRAMSLLELRLPYKPFSNKKTKKKEFYYALQSLISAGLNLRISRNPQIYESFVGSTTKIDDPTRWLDYILTNMHRRGIPLDIHLANAMLSTYSSTGRTGRAVHFFYQLQPIQGPTSTTTTSSSSSSTTTNQKKVKMLRRGPPPSYQIPSQSIKIVPTTNNNNNSNNNDNNKIKSNNNNNNSSKYSCLKLQKEMNPKWSLPLTAAFTFAKGLTQGACGHDPITLDITSYNKLVKACCYRGALWRAIYLLREEIPKVGLRPNTVTYNTILHGLARVGDTAFQRDLLTEMTNQGVPLSEFTVQAIVLGHLNHGDIGGAITLVQDIFNQHGVLPPYTSHLDIIEHSLVNDLVFEAKRHVYFLQQVWRLDPASTQKMSAEKVFNIKFVQESPKIGKEALKKLFEYHGESLTDADFL